MVHPYHKMLAAFGEGSAHPGGFAESIRLLETLDLTPGHRVLDLACGTGRTACYIAAQFGCETYGVDIQSRMVEKARKRASSLLTLTAAPVFLRGDGDRLPFPDEHFDVVLIESALSFMPIAQALQECKRVLKPGGRFANIELCAEDPLPADRLMQLYGVERILTPDEWRTVHDQAGWAHYSAAVHPLNLRGVMESAMHHPDHVQLVSRDSYLRTDYAELLSQNFTFWLDYEQQLRYIVIHASKGTQP